MLDVGGSPASGHPHIEIVNGRPKVVAAIPAFNECATIGAVVRKSAMFADEVVVIDDGSSDGTEAIARSCGARVLRHSENRGKGAAIQTALAYARNNGVGILVFHDADLQHDPAEIPAVVEPIVRGQADVVIGKRWGRQNGMPFYRRVGKRVLDHMTAFATRGLFLTDSQSGFRALSRSSVEMIRVEANGYGIESEMVVQFTEKGLRVAEVPVSARYDVDGSTYHPLRHAIQVIDTNVLLSANARPWLVYGTPGAVALGTAVGLGVATVSSLGVIGPAAIALGPVVGFLAVLGACFFRRAAVTSGRASTLRR